MAQHAPWTSETAPRNGGRRRDGKPRIRPKEARDAAEQYLLLKLPQGIRKLVSAALKNPGGRAMALWMERAMPLLKDSESGKIVLQKITLELSRDDDPQALRALLPSVDLALPCDAQLEPSSSELSQAKEKEEGLEPLPLSPDQASTFSRAVTMRGACAPTDKASSFAASSSQESLNINTTQAVEGG